MEEPYTEGVAIHGGPEPCVDDPRGRGEAWDRGTRRPAIEPRNQARSGCRRCHPKRKATSPAALARVAGGARAVEEPVHARNLHAREPGEPMPARRADHRTGRSGNAEAVRLG
jgi:hypothetical protein